MIWTGLKHSLGRSGITSEKVAAPAVHCASEQLDLSWCARWSVAGLDHSAGLNEMAEEGELWPVEKFALGDWFIAGTINATDAGDMIGGAQRTLE